MKGLYKNFITLEIITNHYLQKLSSEINLDIKFLCREILRTSIHWIQAAQFTFFPFENHSTAPLSVLFAQPLSNLQIQTSKSAALNENCQRSRTCGTGQSAPILEDRITWAFCEDTS